MQPSAGPLAHLTQAGRAGFRVSVSQDGADTPTGGGQPLTDHFGQRPQGRVPDFREIETNQGDTGGIPPLPNIWGRTRPQGGVEKRQGAWYTISAKLQAFGACNRIVRRLPPNIGT